MEVVLIVCKLCYDCVLTVGDGVECALTVSDAEVCTKFSMINGSLDCRTKAL